MRLAALTNTTKAQQWIRFDLARTLYQTGDLPHSADYFKELNAVDHIRRIANIQLQQGEIAKAQISMISP